MFCSANAAPVQSAVYRERGSAAGSGAAGTQGRWLQEPNISASKRLACGGLSSRRSASTSLRSREGAIGKGRGSDNREANEAAKGLGLAAATLLQSFGVRRRVYQQCSARHSCNHLGFGDVCINSVLRDTPAIIWGSATCVSTVFRATLLQSFGVRRRAYQQCSHRWTHAAVLGWQAGGEARNPQLQPFAKHRFGGRRGRQQSWR